MKLEVPGVPEQRLFWLLHASMFRQYCEAVQRLQSGTCPFCELDGNVNRIVCQNGSWFAWPNPWPQPGQTHHLVIAHRRHIRHVEELDPDTDWRDLGKIVDELTSRCYRIAGGVFAMRFGDPKFSLASEEHLHSNIRVPSGEGHVEVTVAWSRSEAGRKMRIACAFEKMRRGTFSELSSREKKLVENRL